MSLGTGGVFPSPPVDRRCSLGGRLKSFPPVFFKPCGNAYVYIHCKPQRFSVGK
jgi:hypothetical protein